ncbi:hypothetical protein EYA84_01995 [Verrucosispora sp. SN26_14.1]|uniref:hypothetical protein n=1 Tax=Verrucosispora sp. SN26_14.1 TaxID=2527879 RepID=UPI0010351762|nr:hypothetical protein [Verrucosispora sp. SN26_14.1]TBL44237.1 hypothetical protein EYA84_01995 [Verrucosispora sp. SN26_14.1]
MEAAERRGISLKRLGGWEPITTTEYEYDESGRLVRSWSQPESEWDQDQQAWVDAWAEYRAQRCPCGCGQRYADVTSEEEGGPQFVADRKVCRARLALLEAQKAAETQDVIGGARLWQVRMVDERG